MKQNSGIETAISLLYKVLVQHGAPYSKTSSLKYAPFKKEIPVQISIEFPGETLHDHFKKKSGFVKSLDQVDLSDMLVMGMVCPRGDGKPSNWVMEESKNGKFRFISVDNDQDLIVDSVVT